MPESVPAMAPIPPASAGIVPPVAAAAPEPPAPLAVSGSLLHPPNAPSNDIATSKTLANRLRPPRQESPIIASFLQKQDVSRGAYREFAGAL